MLAQNIRTADIHKVDTTSNRPNVGADQFREAYSWAIDSLFLELQKNKEFSGTVLVARRGEIIHTGAYGYADLSTKESLTTASEFQLASVSKTITATAILLLQQDGLLDIDDKVKYYVPGFPYEEITIRHLLNHRSGLSRYMGLMHADWDKSKFMNYMDVMNYYVAHKPALFFQPDTKFEYCNTNYVFLAALVEYISKKTFEDFLQARIFKPLGMEHTYLCNYMEREQRENHTKGYQRLRFRFQEIEGDYLDGVFGDKGVYSTVMDMYRFDRALAEGKLLDQRWVTESCLPGSPEQKDHNYGLGWRMKPFFPDLVYHFGWWHGYRTCFIRDLQAETTIIIFSNRDNRQKPFNFWYVYQFVNGWVGHFA